MQTPRIRIAAVGLPSLTAGLFFLAAAAPAADFTIVSKTRFGEKQGTQTVYLTSRRVKTTGGGSDSVVDLESGAMTFLDEEKKTYYETSAEEMAAYGKRREEQSRASGFNTESFGALAKPETRRTGGSRRIAGERCDLWMIRMGDGLVFDVCAARRIPAPDGYFESRGAAYAGMGPMGRHFAKMFIAMKAVKGYPLSLAMHVKLESMKQESLTEATEVKAGPISASTFAIPADYAKKPSPFVSSR